MKNALSAILIFMVLFEKSFGYDGILLTYYKKCMPRSQDLLDYENKFNIDRIPEEFARAYQLNGIPRNQKKPSADDLDRSPITRVFWSQADQLSLKKDESDRIWFGFFFVTELSNSFSPFDPVFSNRSSPVSRLKVIQQPLFQEAEMLGTIQLRLLNQVSLSVIELYDAAIGLNDLDYLSEIKTLEVLGLPCRGVKFDKKFNFPANLKTLVVRNAELNEFFFEALNELKGLKRLVILNCTTTIEYPLILEASYFREQSWRERPRIFKGVKRTLESLEIIKSDPRLLDYAIPETWESLKTIKSDLFSNLFGVRTYMDSAKEFRSTFPVIERISLSISPLYFKIVKQLVDQLEADDKKVSCNLLKYPVFTESKVDLDRYDDQTLK
jgi:hypothetical protein